MKTKFIIIAAAVVFIITVILLFYLHSTNEKEVVRRFQAEQLVASRQLAREIESYLHDRAQGVNILSSFPSLQNRDMKKMTADIQTFFDYVKKDHVKAISVYDEKGTIIYSTIKEAIGRNYQELDFFQWAVKKENKGKQFVSSLIQKTDNQTAPLLYSRFLIASPIYQEVKNIRSQKATLKFIGIVTSTIDLEEVVSVFLPFVSAYAHKEHAYLLDRNGTLLFHSEHPEMVLRNIRSQDKTCFKCHTSFDHVTTILSGKEGTVEFALKERQKKLANFSSMEFNNISWKIVISIPYEEVSGFINRNLYMTFILIGVITLTLIGGSSLIYRSNRLKIRAEEEAKQWMEKRELEDKIRESEERYRTMIETAHDIVWTLDTQGNFTFINSIGEKITGHKFSDWIGKSFVPLILSEDLPKVQEVFLQTLNGTPQSYDVRVYDINGKIVILSVNTVPIYQDDIVVGTVSFGRDITERKRAEEELRESEKRFRFISEQANDLIYVYRFKPTPGFEYVSPAATKITGYTPKEHYNDPQLGFKLVHPADRHILQSFFENEITTKPIVLRWLKKDGTIIWTEQQNVPIYNETGELIEVQGIARDITERKRAEEELKFSHKTYLGIINSLTEAIYIQDENGVFLEVNKTAEKFYGHPKEYFIGKTPELISAPGKNDIPMIAEAVKKAFNGEPQSFEFWGLRENGTIFPKSVNLTSGEYFGKKVVIATARDITERKRAEEVLQESEERFRNIVENIDEVFYVSDGQGKIFYCSPNITTATGYSLQEIIGKSFLRLVAPIDRRILLDNYLEQTTKGVSDTALVFRVRCKDGKIIWVEQITHIVRDTFGNVVEYRNVARDITERKRAEEEIISQRNRFVQLFENSPIAIALLDGQDKIVHINESFSALFDYYLEEIRGQSLEDLIVPHELKEEAKSYSDQTREGNQINKESYRKKKDGTLVYVQIVGVPVIVNEKTVGIYGMYVDLTQRKDAEEKMKVAKELAEQSDKLKSEFLAQMSHEIRTPLNIIIGNVNYIKEEVGDKINTEDLDCLESIDSASRRIIRTVDLILNMTELQTGNYKPSHSKVDIDSQVLKKIYGEYQLMAKQRGIDFIYKCKVMESEIICDEYCATQIFSNLIDNAIKFTKKGKVETLLTKNKDGNIVVEVKDSGIGISKEFLPHLFEPFVQEEQGYTRSFEGNGLGLALVKRYCDINNAVIEVESEKGVGTTFRVIFK